MNQKIKDKINEIDKYLNELEQIMPTDLQEYLNDLRGKAACERYFEKIIESVIDLSFLIIKDKNLIMPESDDQLFSILEKENIITSELYKRLKNAKGIRNIIAHEYGKVDDVIVFHAVTEELIIDVRNFLEKIEEVSDKIKNKKPSKN